MLHTNNVNLAFIWGGDLYMNFCTLAGYSGPSNQHEERYQSKSMWLLNYYIENNQALPSNLSAKIYNSVIYGSLDDEFGADAVTSANFNVDIENCLIKSEAGLSEWQSLCNSFTGNILNEDPGYENTYDMDFSYQTFSPIYRATSSHLLPMDIEEKLRSNPTDIGAWEL